MGNRMYIFRGRRFRAVFVEPDGAGATWIEPEQYCWSEPVTTPCLPFDDASQRTEETMMFDVHRAPPAKWRLGRGRRRPRAKSLSSTTSAPVDIQLTELSARRYLNVVVCGSRDWRDEEVVRHFVLEEFSPDAVMLHAGNCGAERIACAAALARGIKTRAFPLNTLREQYIRSGARGAPSDECLYMIQARVMVSQAQFVLVFMGDDKEYPRRFADVAFEMGVFTEIIEENKK